MEYVYTLSKEDAKKYGFTHLECNGWLGVYRDDFNKKFDDNRGCYVEIELSDKDIDRIIRNAKDCKEYC